MFVNVVLCISYYMLLNFLQMFVYDDARVLDRRLLLRNSLFHVI